MPRLVQRNAAQTVALIHRLLALTFAIVGLIFLLAPDATVSAINAVGALFRIFPPAPASALRFWLSLGFAYMVLVTLLAWRISRDPVVHRGLMPILAAGKFASSFTCLLFFIVTEPAFLYLLNFLVDGSIVLIVLGCYVSMRLSEPSSRQASPQGRTAELLRLITDTMVPAGGPFEQGASSERLDEAVWRYFGQLHPLGSIGLSVLVHTIEFAPLLFGPQRRRFSGLSAAQRELHLDGWENSRLALRRQVMRGLKLAVMLHFYDSPQVCAAIGYDGSYLRDKLLAGPNAASHRARLA
jgi:hypothetical protein